MNQSHWRHDNMKPAAVIGCSPKGIDSVNVSIKAAYVTEINNFF